MIPARTACALVVAAAALAGLPVYAQSSSPVLARGQILLTGAALRASPEHQTVPRNIATSVAVQLGTTAVASDTSSPDPSTLIPADALVYADLRGPAFGAPVTLVARLNEPIRIQPLAITGIYVVENIRLVSGGVTFLQATPETVTIDVIDKVLVSQVTTRALTAKEIQQKGIFVDQTNFDVVNFMAAFGIQGGQKTIDFPIVLPKRPSSSLPASAPPPSLPPLSPAAALPPPQALPQLQQVFQTNNVSISGLVLKFEDEELERQFSIPPIPGVIIIPGNIAFLHQFFSVLLMVSNVAPGASSLVVRDVTGTIVLPPGADAVPGSDDDPLRMARTGTPPVEQPSTQPVVQPGPDGKIGTVDDVTSLAPGQNGNAEFLVEGRKEGTYTVQIQISAILDGLPIGPVKITGFATGIVEVRNPTFSLTLSHPATVTAGEAYDLLVTVSNTSDSPANLVSVNLSPNSISGATLDSDQSVTLDTIAAHDAATASFHLISQQTGNVTATSFTSDDAPGKFVLRTAVGALGIPLSPNTLVLPGPANSLPADLRLAGIGLLGQADALATAPTVPAGLLPITQQIVYERATNLAQAGQRLQMGDTLAHVGEDLALDMLGNGFARLPDRLSADPSALQQAQLDYQGFDDLFRQSPRGPTLLRALSTILGADVQSEGALQFQSAWATRDASQPPFISAITGSSGAGAPVVLRMTGPDGTRVGLASPGGSVARDLAFANFLTLIDSAPTFSQLILDTVPSRGAYTIELRGTGSGTFDLGLVVPDGDHLRHITYEGVPISTGARAVATFTVGGPSTFTLSIDDDGDGVADRTIAPSVDEELTDVGPTLVSAVQVVTGSPDSSQFGQVVGLLFSDEISVASSQNDATSIAAYQVDGNQVLGATLQPGGRVLLLSLRDGVGPFVPRTVTVTGMQDRFGHPMSPSASSMNIAMTISNQGASIAGQVRAADGTPIHNARLQLSQTAPVGVPTGALAGLGDLSPEREVTVTVKDLDSSGRYAFDYVRDFGGVSHIVHLQAINLDTGESGEVITHISRPGQHMDLDIIFIGTGTVVGRAFAPGGATPLAGAVVKVSSLTRLGRSAGAVTDASGAFSIAGVPAGNFTIEAVHVPTNSKTVAAGSIPAAGATVVQNLTLIPVAEVVVTTGTVRGQVFHASDGSPAIGVPVYTDRGGLATTDSVGIYRIDTLPPGPMSVKAIDQVRLEQALISTTIVGGNEVIANLLLVGGTGTVQGVVIDATGHRVANALIGGGVALVRTDANGVFVLVDVPIGSRSISAFDETTQTTASGTINLLNAGDSANIELVLPGRGSVAGRVFEADGVTPIPNLKVFLFGSSVAATVTDANGGYRFDRLPLGTYTVSAFKDGFSDGNVADTKLVFQGEVHVTNIVARGKGRVTGIVLAADGATPLGARVGFSELQVRTGTLAPLDNPSCLGDIEVGDTTIEMPKCQVVGLSFASTPLTRIVDNDVSSGAFAFNDVFVGPFTVEAANAFSPTIMRAAAAIAHSGDTASVVLKLQATSSVKGVVYQPDGGTPVGKNVVVTFNSGTLNNVNVITDEHGSYLYPLVNPGPFSVTTSDPSTGLVGRSDGTVDAGATANVPIRLLAKGSVKVSVTGSNGPTAGAVVTVTRGTFPNDSRQAVTESSGSITFSGGDSLTEGPFGVSAYEPATGITGFGSGSIPTSGIETDVQVRLDDQMGSVHGLFVMPDAVTRIPNAQVHITSARGQAFATTDAGGAFNFDGVFGTFTVEAFDPVTARRGRSAGTISLNHQDVAADIEAVAQGTVRGVVRFSNDNSAAAAADVTLSISSAFGGQLVTSSGVDGSFTFPGVSAGDLTIAARDPSTGSGGSVAATLTLEGDVVSVDVVLQVPRLGRVQGTVRRADGSPAIGAQVSLSNGVPTTVDNAGSYAVDNVAIGRVTVSARAPTGYDGGIGSGELKFDGDLATIDVTFIGTGTVSSTVRSAAGAAVPFAAVTLTSRNALQRGVSLTNATDVDGQVRFSGVPVGDVSVTAVDVATALAGSSSGQIGSDNATLDLPITLQPAGSVRARIVRQDRVTPAVGLAVELTGQSQHFGSTAADGTFGFDNLPLGQYQLLLTDPLGTGIARTAASVTQAGQIVDLGVLYLDESPPAVQEITPAAGSASVPVTQPIRVLFSEAIDPATVTTDTLRVSTPAGPVAGAWTLNADRTAATFLPAAPYQDFMQVAVKVTTGVMDLVGKPLAAEMTSTFTTADGTPPVTISRAPLPGARGVPAAAVVRIAYSEAIDPARFAGAPPISVSLDSVPVAGRIDFTLGNTVIVFTPSSPLAANGTYRVVALPAADVFGNSQTTGSAFSFSTVDTIAPSIDALASATGNHVKVGSTATLTASVSAIDAAFVELLLNGAVIQTRFAAPFVFSVPVTAALAPSFSVAARATDQSGNVGDPRSLLLAVDPDLPPTVTITSPADGATVNSGAHVLVSFHATDDVGVTQVGLQTAGALNTTAAISVNPPAPSRDAVFPVDIPADAAGGSRIDLKVAAIDTAGQSSATSTVGIIVADVTPPVAAIVSPGAGAMADAGQTLAVTVSASDASGIASLSLQASGAAIFSETRPLSPAQPSIQAVFQVPIPSTARPTDRVTLNIAAVDAFGNVASPTTLVVSIRDAVPPAVSLTIDGGLTRAQPGRAIGFLVSATDAGGLTTIGYEASGAVTATASQAISPAQPSASGAFSLIVPAATPIGTVLTFAGTAADASGNVGRSFSVSVSIVADEPPTVHLTAPPAGTAVVEGASLIVAADAFDDVGIVSVEFRINGQSVATQTAAPFAAQLTAPGGADGSRLVIQAIATDTAGQSTADSVTLTLHVDTTPPRLASMAPADKSVDVSIGTSVVATFTEPLDPASVTADSFRISSGGTPIAGVLTPADGNTTVRFAPNGFLPLDSAIVVQISSAITDRFGNALVDADGGTLTQPLTFTFATGRFAISKPSRSESVVEKSRLTIEARGSSSLGIASVAFTVNGAAVPASGGPVYTADIDVPARSAAPTLTIGATARDGAGQTLAVDQVTVDVTVGLEAAPAIVGIPLGGTGLVRLTLSSALSEDLAISFEAVDAGVVAPPASPVTLPAGRTAITAAIGGTAEGNTTVLAHSTRGTASFIASVSVPAARQTLTPLSASTGVGVRPPPIAAQVAGAPAGVVNVSMRATTDPVTIDTAVSVTSSDESIARVIGTPLVRSGQRVASLSIATGAPGTALLSVRAGGQTFGVLVVVGAPGSVPSLAALAPGVGLAVAHGRGSGQLITPAGGRQTIAIRLLSSPVAINTSVTVSSSNPAVASVEGQVIVRAGEQTATVTIVAGAAGVADLVFAAGGDVQTLSVNVGVSPASVAPILAHPVGVALVPPPSVGRLLAPMGARHTLGVRVLAQPTSADTPIAVSSSDPLVASVLDTTMVLAGEQTANVTIATGTPGVATLTLRVGADVRELTVVVGGAATQQTPAVVAVPVGVAVQSAPQAGVVISPLGAVAIVSLRVLSARATGDVLAEVTSSDPNVASVQGPVVIHAGEQVAQVGILTTVQGVAELTVRAGGQTVRFIVITGTPPVGSVPVIVAPIVGVKIQE